jgi:hypothetical protein
MRAEHTLVTNSEHLGDNSREPRKQCNSKQTNVNCKIITVRPSLRILTTKGATSSPDQRFECQPQSVRMSTPKRDRVCHNVPHHNSELQKAPRHLQSNALITDTKRCECQPQKASAVYPNVSNHFSAAACPNVSNHFSAAARPNVSNHFSAAARPNVSNHFSDINA